MSIKNILLLACLILAPAQALALGDDEMGVVVRNVKSGNWSEVYAPIFTHPDGRRESSVLIYDAGTAEVGGLAEKEIEKATKESAENVVHHLKKGGIRNFGLVISHADADHLKLADPYLQALGKTLKKANVPVLTHKFCLLGGCEEEYMYERKGLAKKGGKACLKAIRNFFKSTEIRFTKGLQVPPQLSLGPVKYAFLAWQFLENALETNSQSIVLRLDYQGGSVLFMGDANAQTIVEIFGGLLREGKSAQALKTKLVIGGHHGAISDGCNNPTFIQLLDCEIVAFSVGPNTYGHPVFRVLESYVAHSPNLRDVGKTHALQSYYTARLWNRQDAWMVDPLAAVPPAKKKPHVLTSFTTTKAVYSTWAHNTLTFVVKAQGDIVAPNIP